MLFFSAVKEKSADLRERFEGAFSSQYFWACICDEDVVFDSDAEFSRDINSGLDGDNITLL